MHRKMSIKVFIFSILAISLLATACITNKPASSESAQNASATTPNNSAVKTPEPLTTVSNSNTPAVVKNVAKPDKRACLNAKLTGKNLYADQTFVFDFEPFPNACFVTFGDNEQMIDKKDLPRGSTFYVFRDGQQVYEFPDAFDGLTGCWPEGVGFEDLNGDGKTDVIIAGKCLGAKSAYVQNAVYINTGSAFTTKGEANESLSEFERVRDIANFVKKNPKLFF